MSLVYLLYWNQLKPPRVKQIIQTESFMRLHFSSLRRQLPVGWLIRFLEQSHKIKKCKPVTDVMIAAQLEKKATWTCEKSTMLSEKRTCRLCLHPRRRRCGPAAETRRADCAPGRAAGTGDKQNWDPASVSWEERPGDATATGGQDTIRHQLDFTTSADKSCTCDWGNTAHYSSKDFVLMSLLLNKAAFIWSKIQLK